MARSDAGDAVIYNMITDSGVLGILTVRREYDVTVGDLIFDIGRLFVVRPTSNQYDQCHLVAQSTHSDLWLLRPQDREEKYQRYTHEGFQYTEPCDDFIDRSFNSVCRSANDFVSRLREDHSGSDEADIEYASNEEIESSEEENMSGASSEDGEDGESGEEELQAFDNFHQPIALDYASVDHPKELMRYDHVERGEFPISHRLVGLEIV